MTTINPACLVLHNGRRIGSKALFGASRLHWKTGATSSVKKASVCCRGVTTATTAEYDVSESRLNFEFNDTQREFQSLVRKFTKEEIIPVAAKHDRSMEFPWEVVKKAWSLGLTTAVIPEKYGGGGVGVVESCILTEEVAFGCTGILNPVIGSGLVAQIVDLGTNEQLKKKYIGQLVAEPVVAAFCVTEPDAGSDVSGIKTRAVKQGNEWIINGQKMWITGGGVASWFFVLCRTNPDPKCPAGKAFSAFVVDVNAPGVSIGRKEIMMGQRCTDVRSIKFEDARIPHENLLGEEGLGFRLAMGAFDKTRPAVAAGAVGLARRALDEATRYALQRKTFGTEIINHQSVANMIADMAINVEVSRLITYKSAWEADKGRRNTYYASIAKTIAAEAAVKATADAVQIFGGNGFNTEYPVEKLMRDAKVYQIYEGTTQIQKSVVARELVGKMKERN